MGGAGLGFGSSGGGGGGGGRGGMAGFAPASSAPPQAPAPSAAGRPTGVVSGGSGERSFVELPGFARSHAAYEAEDSAAAAQRGPAAPPPAPLPPPPPLPAGGVAEAMASSQQRAGESVQLVRDASPGARGDIIKDFHTNQLKSSFVSSGTTGGPGAGMDDGA